MSVLAGVLAGALVGTTGLAAGLALGTRPAGRARRRLAGASSADGPAGSWASGRAVAALEALGLQPGATWLTALLALAGVVAVGAVRAAGLPGLAVAGGAMAATPPVVARLAARRADRLAVAALPGALEAVARAVRAGRSLQQAVGDAARATPGPLGGELAEVARRARDGMPLAAAVGWWRSARPVREVRLAAAALELGARAGGVQARALDGVAATLRDEQALAAEVRAHSAQARLSATLIALAPFGFAALTCTVDPSSAHFLLRTPAGWLCLAVAALLDGGALVWMRHLTRRAAWSP